MSPICLFGVGRFRRIRHYYLPQSLISDMYSTYEPGVTDVPRVYRRVGGGS